MNVRNCFVADTSTGSIRFTKNGYKQYGVRFAKAGIDINRILTREQFRQACKVSQWVLMDEIRQMVRGHKELEMVLKSLWS